MLLNKESYQRELLHQVTHNYYHNQLDSIIAVTVDHNVIIYGLPELETKKQVSHLSENVVLVRSIDLKFYDLLCVLLECFMNFMNFMNFMVLPVIYMCSEYVFIIAVKIKHGKIH